MDHGTEDLDKTDAMVLHAAVSDVEGTASEDEVCVTQNVRERALTGALNITQRQSTGVVGSPLPRPTTQRSSVDSDEHQVVVPRSQRDDTEVGRFHHRVHTSTDPGGCQIAPKMFWIHSFVGISHSSGFVKSGR